MVERSFFVVINTSTRSRCKKKPNRATGTTGPHQRERGREREAPDGRWRDAVAASVALPARAMLVRIKQEGARDGHRNHRRADPPVEQRHGGAAAPHDTLPARCSVARHGCGRRARCPHPSAELGPRFARARDRGCAALWGTLWHPRAHPARSTGTPRRDRDLAAAAGHARTALYLSSATHEGVAERWHHGLAVAGG